MTTESLTLNETGQKLLRYLAAKYPERAMVDFLERDRIIQENNLTDDDYDRFIAMFERCQLVRISPCQSGRYAEIVHVEGAAVLAVNQLDNQPPPDYWKKVGIWFRSKWWSVPVLLFIAVVTVIGGFISVIKTIIDLLNN
jgi:hypothetical protein